MSGESEAMARAGEADAIVRALAACEEPREGENAVCLLCAADGPHADTCVWLRAKRYVEARG